MSRRPDVLCAGSCGKKMWRGSGSLTPGKAMCRPCRAARVRTKPCAACGAEFKVVRASSGRTRTTCSDACASTARARSRPPRESRKRSCNCEVCGAGYFRSYSRQRTCGRTCGTILKARNRPAPQPKPESKLPPVPVTSTCRACHAEVEAAWLVLHCSKKCANDWRNARLRASRKRNVVCAECGSSFVGSESRRFCSKPCYRKSSRRTYRTPANHRKRARKYGVPYESVKPIYIFERDRWICGICKKRISKTAKLPDLMSASLDHVIPLSLGLGISPGHVLANLQAAHFLCNSLKGAGVAPAGEQLLLVG